MDNVTSLVERMRRFSALQHNNESITAAVDGVIRMLQLLSQMAYCTITFDHTTEFAECAYLQNGIRAQTWLYDLQSPCQKDTVENTNRRTRRWLP